MNSTNFEYQQPRFERGLVASLLGFLLVFEVNASTPQIPFKELVNAAKDIAIVEVRGGDELLNSEACGWHYKARVIKHYKGEVRDILQFGSRDGLKIGGKYFVVLNGKDVYIRSYLGKSSSSTCKTVLPERMMSNEFVAMPIDNPSELDYATEAVMVPSLSIQLPRGTKCTQATSVDDFYDALDAVWVKIPEMEKVTLDSEYASKNGEDAYLGSRECAPPSAKLMGNFSAAPALWRLIDLLEEKKPLTRRNIEKLLGVSMALVKRTPNISEWKGAPVNIRSDLGISSSSVLAKDAGESTSLEAAKINLIGECISPSEIEAYYGVISSEDQILMNPGEGSTVYRYDRGWGVLEFGFEDVAPGCLAFIRLQGH